MRVGQLVNGEAVKGVVKVFEQWKEIKKNAEKYFYEIISEIPLDLIKPLVKRLKEKSGLTCQCIISESVIVPKGRKKLLKELEFEKLIKEGRISRKMFNVQTVLVLNEKEACVSFPDTDGEPDITQMFYSNDPKFHEWCLDYFRYCWYAGSTFNENKIKV